MKVKEQTSTRPARRSRRPHIELMELRINRGWTPADLAFRAGIDQKTVRLVEAGWRPGPRVQYAIASQFDLAPTDLWPLTKEAVRR